MKRLTILALISALFLSSCLESGGLKDINAPNLSVACDKDQVSNCSNASGAGRTLYLGLLESGSVDCETYLHQIPPGQFYSFFNLSGTDTTAYSGTTTTGTVSAWVDRYNSAVTRLADTTYQVCGFIDTNSDGEIDSEEPMTEAFINPSFPQTINMWINY